MQSCKQIESAFDTIVKGIMIEIQKNNLMNDELIEFFNVQIMITLQFPKKKVDDSRLVSKYTGLVKDMFKGVVNLKNCVMVSKKMVRIMKKYPEMESEEACMISAEAINNKKGKAIFPLDEETFERMLKGIQ